MLLGLTLYHAEDLLECRLADVGKNTLNKNKIMKKQRDYVTVWLEQATNDHAQSKPLHDLMTFTYDLLTPRHIACTDIMEASTYAR